LLFVSDKLLVKYHQNRNQILLKVRGYVTSVNEWTF